MNELEKELANYRNSSEETRKGYQQQLQDYDKVMENLTILRYIL